QFLGGFAGATVLPLDIIGHENFSERVSDVLRQLRIGVSIMNDDEIGLRDWLDSLAADDSIFIRLERCQVFIAQLFLFLGVLVSRGCSGSVLRRKRQGPLAREDLLKGSKDRALSLRPKEIRIVLQVELNHSLTGQRRILQHLQLRPPKIRIVLANKNTARRS